MATTTITSFRKNIYEMVKNTVKYNEPIIVTTKFGNAVMISEEEYRGLIETLSLVEIPGMKDKLLEGMNESLSEAVPADEVDW